MVAVLWSSAISKMNIYDIYEVVGSRYYIDDSMAKER
jgi:hypothetical protein